MTTGLGPHPNYHTHAPRGRASGRKNIQHYSRSNTTLVVIATLTYRRDYTENPNAMTTPAA